MASHPQYWRLYDNQRGKLLLFFNVDFIFYTILTVYFASFAANEILLTPLLTLFLHLTFDIIVTGDFASFEASGMVFTPALTLILHRKCVSAEDFAGLFIAAAGVLCITHPSFIFGTEPNAAGVPLMA